MAGVGPGDLHDLATELLGIMAEALDTIPDTEPGLDGAPGRQFVSPGEPVDDCCPQLTIHIPFINEADTTPGGLMAGQRHRLARLNHVTFLGRVTRCIPTGSDSQLGSYTPPTPESLDLAAEQLDADAWALWNHLFETEREVAGCNAIFFDALVAVVPSGGCAGWTVTIRAQLDGYIEAIGS